MPARAPCLAPNTLRGSSVLGSLAAAGAAAMMALLIQADLFTANSRLMRTLDNLVQSIPTVSEPAAERSYGACGDICVVGGACRHIVLRNGLHGGQKVSPDVLMAAESCH